jgi:FdhE protein
VTAAAPTDPELARGLEVLRLLADAWSRMPVPMPEGVPSVEAASERMRNGIPGLAEEPLLGEDALRAALSAVSEALTASQGYAAAGSLGHRLVESSLDWARLVPVALSGSWEALAGFERRVEPASDTAEALLDYSVRPALREGARRIRSAVAQSGWARGSCPACGTPPLLSVTTGKEASRFLLCGRCGTAWPWARVRCASCGETDHHRLGYLHGAGEGQYRRVEVCDSCRGYLKTVAVLDLPDPDRLLRLDLETAALDFAALDGGYRR